MFGCAREIKRRLWDADIYVWEAASGGPSLALFQEKERMMATTIPTASFSNVPRLGVARVAFTTALVAMAFLLLCWIAARLGLGPSSHMALQLFTADAGRSGVALLVGLCSALIGGGVAGALFAWIYNLLAPLDPRS